MLNHSNTADDTILTAALTAGATAIPVASAAGWPAPPFAAVLTPGTSATEEIVLVTAVVGATWTATRGYDGTTAKSHAAGATVRHAVIAADLNLDAAAVGADPAGTASASMAAHLASADPHPQYQTPAEGDARYWPLTTDLATQAELDTHAALTTTAHGGIVASTDPRLSDARTPAAHAASHAAAGSDPLTLSQSQITGLVSALAAKLAAASNLADLASAAAARGNLGLGTAAQANTGTGASDLPTTTQADARYQPLDSDLTAIAALTTTAYGRALLALADAAALRTTAGAEAALGTPASDGSVLSSTTAGVRSWVAPGGGVARGRIKVGSTTYWSLPGVVPIGATGTGALVANRLYAMPILLESAVTLTDIGCEVTTGAAGGLVRCGLCTADPDWAPGALVSGTDAAEYDGSTAGEKVSTGLSIALAAGRYYLLILANTSPPTVRLVRGVLPGLLFQAAWSGNVYTISLFASQAYGPLPASPPALGTLSAGNAPAFDYRVLIKYTPS